MQRPAAGRACSLCFGRRTDLICACHNRQLQASVRRAVQCFFMLFDSDLGQAAGSDENREWEKTRACGRKITEIMWVHDAVHLVVRPVLRRHVALELVRAERPAESLGATRVAHLPEAMWNGGQLPWGKPYFQDVKQTLLRYIAGCSCY
eukprot:scaffold28505_cov132-Isochrysis_galbana.AAC.1